MSRKRSPAKRSLRKLGTQFNQYTLDQLAEAEGPRRKNWHFHDLKHITALTESQRIMIDSFNHGDHICAAGSAGTGKTFVAIAIALRAILSGEEQKRLVIVRSVVPTRDIGFLPGTIDEKIAVYEQPYRDILTELTGHVTSYNHMKEASLIEFVPTSFIRGVTWDNCVIVVDEAQNMTDMELHSIMTRVGEGSRVIVAGDTLQNDLLSKRNSETSGFVGFLEMFASLPNAEVITFTKHDIVRSEFVKSWILAREQRGLI